MQDVSNATTTTAPTATAATAGDSDRQEPQSGSGLLVRTLWLVGSYLLVMGLIVVAQS